MTTSRPVAELTFGTPDALKNLGVLARKTYALDENTSLCIQARKTTTGIAAGISSSSAPAAAPAVPQVWMKTPIGPLTMRVIALRVLLDDVVATAVEIKDIMVRALAQARLSDGTEDRDASFAALPYRVHTQSASSWPGFLPVPEGWQAVGYVSAAALRTLEKQGRAITIGSSGPMSMPPSLLGQKVLTVSGGTGETTVDTGKGQSRETSKNVVDVTIQDVFALCTTGFIPKQPDEKEPVRVSARGR